MDIYIKPRLSALIVYIINVTAHNYAVVQEMAKKFRERSGGSIICKELLGLKKPEGSTVPAERNADYYKKRPCVELIGVACDIIEETFDLGGHPLA